MSDSRLPKFLFILFSVVAFAYFFQAYGQLSARVASHFDIHGAANGWQSKQEFYGFLVGTVMLVALIGFGIPRLFNTIPIQLMNLPNREYWLAPERRADSINYLAVQFAWLACALLLLILFSFNYAIQCNLHPENPPDGSAITYPLIAFAVFMAVWMMRMFTRFAKPEEESGDNKKPTA